MAQFSARHLNLVGGSALQHAAWQVPLLRSPFMLAEHDIEGPMRSFVKDLGARHTARALQHVKPRNQVCWLVAPAREASVKLTLVPPGAGSY